MVPALVLSNGTLLTQSLAIIEFLDETNPEPPLLPKGIRWPGTRQMLAQMIACDIHPVNNLRVLTSLRTLFGAGDQDITNWFRSLGERGFSAARKDPRVVARDRKVLPWRHAGVADICLAAQVTNNARFGVDMTPYPTIARINAACMALPAFQQAAPQNQVDAE